MKIYTTAQFFANEGLYITSQLGPLYDFYFINLSPANGAAFTNSLGRIFGIPRIENRPFHERAWAVIRPSEFRRTFTKPMATRQE
jgi:hypothetical protein